jgi:hypothetical protein
LEYIKISALGVFESVQMMYKRLIMDKLYEFIFENTYNISLPDIKEDVLKDVKEDIISLRNSYRSDFCVTGYDLDRQRNAYMISYFPHYISPAYNVSRRTLMPLLKGKLTNSSRIYISYFAGGPCPELVGTVMAFHDSGLDCRIDARILDFEKGWAAQSQTTLKLIQEYFPDVKVSLKTYSGCDIMLDCRLCSDCWDYCSNDLYKKTDIYFMQNCLNHINKQGDFIQNIKNKISYASPGAVFVFIDLNYRVVKDVMKSLIEGIKGSARVVDTNINGMLSLSECPEQMPQILKDKVFTGEKFLIPKIWTKYYYTVLLKEE